MRRCPVRLSVLAILPLLLGPLAFAGPVQPTFAAAGATQDTAGAKILRIHEDAFPPHLDPFRSVGSEVWVAILNYEGLTRLDEELTIVPAAAESWAFNDDGTILTFHLREGLTYSDGSPLVAERFRFAVERTCDPRTDSPLAVTLFDVVGCEAFSISLAADPTDDAAYQAARAGLGVSALDDRTLEVRLRHPSPFFLNIASTVVFYPVKQELVEAGGAEWWLDPANQVGNGMFQIARIDRDGSPARIAFAANEHYWRGRPKLDGVEYVYFGDTNSSEQALAAYRRGELELAWPPDADMPAIEADPVLSRELVRQPVAFTNHLAFNLTRAPFTDKRVREAFAYGFDREAFCRQIGNGYCTPTLSWIPAGVPGHIETDAYAFDPEAARQALAESSYGGPEQLPEIVWYYVEGNAGDARSAEWVAAQYRQILGVELRLTPTTEEEMDAMFAIGLPADAGTWQLSLGGWYSEFADPQEWLSAFWTCSAIVARWVGYCNPAFDELVGRANAELDPVKRLALYEAAERLLVADAPTVFLNNPLRRWLVKPYVTGYITTVPSMGWPGWTTLLTVNLAPHQDAQAA